MYTKIMQNTNFVYVLYTNIVQIKSLYGKNLHQIPTCIHKMYKLLVQVSGGSGPKPKIKMENPKSINLLILEHLKSHFINPSLLNKFLICFEINGLKYLKLTILRFLPRPPTYPYYSNSSKNIFYC